MKNINSRFLIIIAWGCFLAGCILKTAGTSPPGKLITPASTELDPITISLSSLKKVEEYPLYTLRLQGYSEAVLQELKKSIGQRNPTDLPSKTCRSTQCLEWGCALFTALGEASNYIYGRNFDWEYSPALLLFNQPDDAYASVSVVDMAYLDFSSEQLQSLESLSIEERFPLLEAVNLPFDGMNEKGLVIGMAAVPPGNVPLNPAKPTLDSLEVIRLVLDQAETIDEAIGFFKANNIDWSSGPPLHYLVADRSGKAALIEFFQGKLLVHYNEQPYYLATNFLVSENPDQLSGQCWRYDRIAETLKQNQGIISLVESLGLLSQVSQDITQWSVVYNFSNLQVDIVMGRKFETVHTFSFSEVMAP